VYIIVTAWVGIREHLFIVHFADWSDFLVFVPYNYNSTRISCSSGGIQEPLFRHSYYKRHNLNVRLNASFLIMLLTVRAIGCSIDVNSILEDQNVLVKLWLCCKKRWYDKREDKKHYCKHTWAGGVQSLLHYILNAQYLSKDSTR
jgi:hypothetical protein